MRHPRGSHLVWAAKTAAYYVAVLGLMYQMYCSKGTAEQYMYISGKSETDTRI